MSRSNIYIGLLCVMMCFVACDQEEQLPAYLYIEDINLDTQLEIEGSDSENIKDAWIFVDDQKQGLFELPASIPLLESGTHNIKVFSGIYNRGIAGDRLIYPIYKAYETNVDLAPLETVTLEPTVTYKDESIFKMIEDFEQGFSLNITEGEGTLETSTEEVLDGERALRVALNTDAPFLEFGTSTAFLLPTDGSATFLEMDYLCEVPFHIFVRTFDDQGIVQLQVSSVFKKDNWNKIYIDLTATVERLFSDGYAGPYQIIFRSELTEDMDDAILYWDNIKLIHL